VIGKVWLSIAAVVVVAIGVVAFVSYGHGTSGTRAQRVESWIASTHLGQDIGTLEGDSAHVREALAARRGARAVAAAHTVCAAMADDAQTFNDSLPAPDTTLTQWLAKAYSLEYDAAEACYRAPSVGSPLLATAARDSRHATALFDEVVRRVRSITNRTLPTTTTTVPDLTGTSIL
jgi:hypothetical protein